MAPIFSGASSLPRSALAETMARVMRLRTVRPSSLRATRAQLEAELAVLHPFLAEAELDLVVTIAVRLWVGRSRYSCVDLANDRRDFAGEALGSSATRPPTSLPLQSRLRPHDHELQRYLRAEAEQVAHARRPRHREDDLATQKGRA